MPSLLRLSHKVCHAHVLTNWRDSFIYQMPAMSHVLWLSLSSPRLHKTQQKVGLLGLPPSTRSALKRLRWESPQETLAAQCNLIWVTHLCAPIRVGKTGEWLLWFMGRQCRLPLRANPWKVFRGLQELLVCGKSKFAELSYRVP